MHERLNQKLPRRTRYRVSALALMLGLSANIWAASCASDPEQAWQSLGKNVSSNDFAAVVSGLTPAFSMRVAAMLSIAANMQVSFAAMGGAVGEQAVAAANVEKAKRIAALDAVLKKHGAPTMAEIGKPLFQKMSDPAVHQLFAKVDVTSLSTALQAFLAAQPDATEQSRAKFRLIRNKDLDAPLVLTPSKTADSAQGSAGDSQVRFARAQSCWLVDDLGPKAGA